jgi:CRP/FNR family nitrogen fixation transcriptional regulator
MLTQASWPETGNVRPLGRQVYLYDGIGKTPAVGGARGAAVMTFARDAEIYGEGEPADYLYEVLSGAVRTCKILADGRRQISNFYLAGDFFGLESGTEHLYSAEAVAGCRVIATKRRAFDALATHQGDGSRTLLQIAIKELRHAQEHAFLLIRSAQERVAGFLLDMGRRSAADEFDLPMSRQEIADYLGLTIETVSRTMTGFEASALIALPSARHVVLRDRRGLQRLNA